MIDLRKALKDEKIQLLRLRIPTTASSKDSLGEVLTKMRVLQKGHVVVLDSENKVLGIFTERDVLTRVMEQNPTLTLPIEQFMTSNPKVLKMDDSIADAIRLMSEGNYRHMPLVDEHEKFQGVLGVRDLIQYLAEHFPYEVYNLPPDPQQVMRAPEGA